MHRPLQAEDHYVVTGLDACVAVHELSLAVTHETGYSEITAQLQVLNVGTGHAVSLFDNDLGNFGIGQGKATCVVLIGINQNLVDAA